MRKTLLITSVALLGMLSAAQAQSTTSTTVTETTTTTTVPDDVRTYVVGQEATSLTLDGEIVVGEALPETVTVTPIPDNSDFGYAIVNDRRVVLDPQTRTVIEVID